MQKLFLLFSFFICLTASSQSKDEQLIRQLLQHQSAAWNRGDIPGFMQGYWQNDSLMFVGKSGITYGWTNTLNNYKKNYPDAAAMGQLDFTLIRIKRLSAEYFTVVGKWHLQRSAGDLAGYFNLLFQKINGVWAIIMDHSS